MAIKTIDDTILSNIANAIREVNGTENTYRPSQMANVIDDFYDTSGDDATVNNVLSGKKFHTASGAKVGEMPNRGGVSATISNKNDSITIQSGFTTGGTIGISTEEKNKIVAGNIKKDVTILGVTGSLETHSDPVLQNKTVKSTTVQQTITAGEGYDGIGTVTVSPIVLETKTVKSTTSSQTISPTSGKDGISQITVSPIVLETKTVKSTDAEQTVTPSTGKDGISQITVSPISLQNKVVTPSVCNVTVTPDSGYDALSSVVVSGDADLIAGNIKKDVTIFGVTGTLESGGTPVLQNKEVKSDTLQDLSVTADSGYDGLGTVTVKRFKLNNSQIIIPTTIVQTVTAGCNYDAMGLVTVQGDTNLIATNIKKDVSIFGVTGSYEGSSSPVLQSKTVTLGNTQQTITADSGYDGLSSVSVPAINLQNKTVTPTSSQQTITADSGYDGLGTVTVGAGGGGSDNLPAFVDGNSYSDDFTISGVSNYNPHSARSVSLPNTSTISNYAFVNSENLISVNAPCCISVGTYAFAYIQQTNPITIYLPLLRMVGQYAFSNSNGIQSISLPAVTDWGESDGLYNPAERGFYSCPSLQSVDLPNATVIPSYMFNSCSHLTSVNIPKVTTIKSTAFQFCSALQSINLPECTVIESSAFRNCSQLVSLTLGANTVCVLRSSNVFTSSGIANNSNARIYVPSDLVETYKSAQNWSTLSSKIEAIPEQSGGE